MRPIDEFAARGTSVPAVHGVARSAVYSAVRRLLAEPGAQEQLRSRGAPLSPAELRLLPYLQTHLTVREIGERLFVSRNTARSEIGSIYRKLGASSRSDAVRRAMAVGLLGG